MGKLLATRERVTIAIELERVLGAPALLWNEEKKDWERSDCSVRQMMGHLLWIRLCHAHPELADARLYGDIKVYFDPKTGCMTAEFERVSDTRKSEQEHGVFIVDVGQKVTA